MNASPDATRRPGLIAWFASHPTAANLLMCIFLAMGVLALPQLRRETFPDFTATEVEVTVNYPGATAEEVEESVCRRVEDALDGINNVKEVRSQARENIATIVVEMDENGNLGQFLTDVKTEVEAIDDFPEDVEDPVIKQINRTDLVLSVAVTGPMSVPDLKLYCEQVKDRMLLLPEISQVELQGFSERQIRVELSTFALQQFGLSIQDVATRIAQQNVDLPAGTVETKDTDILLRFAEQRATIQEFEDLRIVSNTTGAELTLGEIATVTDTFELDEERILFNGQRAGVLMVKKNKQEDALHIMGAVKSFLEREREQAPPTVTYTITQNISKIVQDRLSMLVVNGEQGLVLVFLSLWLFFSFRFSFWVAMGLPVSFMATFFLMQQFGFSLNMITMVGLLLALGLLMDDALVIAENVAAHMEKGKKALSAAIDGTREVLPGVLSSFLTTVFVFGSVAVFIKGDIGKVLWVMPVVLILTLSVSLVEAFCILPNHLAHALHGREKAPVNAIRRRLEAGVDWVRESLLGRFVDWAVAWRYLFVGLVFSLFLVSLGMVLSGKLKTSPFPDIDGDVLMARILLPQGTPLTRTEGVVDRVANALKAVDEEFTPRQPLWDGKRPHLVQNISIQYNLNADAGEQGPHVATVTADLLEAERRNATIDAVSASWREKVGNVADVLSITYKEPQIGPAGLAIDIRLQGEDLRQLDAAAEELMSWLAGYKGVVDLQDDLRPGKPELLVTLRKGALALGYQAESIARQLRAAFYGVTADEIQVGSESYEIDVRLRPEDQNSLADLDFFHITGSDGEQVPLQSVAVLTEGRGWSRIARIDSVRTVTVQGDVDTRLANANDVIADTRQQFLPGLQERYPDLRINFEGQAAEGGTTQLSLRRAFLVGLFGIFVLLSFQFKSYLEPIVVIMTIPLALIGVVWGHVLLGQELTMPSIMGFVSLAGVVVNDSILLVQFIKIHIAGGETVQQAATRASRLRFRAILLTSLTTILGLTPLMLEKSLQAQLLIPLAVSIVFGLLASTVLVLVVVPALYAILDDLGMTAIKHKEL